jgi:hypothetical protein
MGISCRACVGGGVVQQDGGTPRRHWRKRARLPEVRNMGAQPDRILSMEAPVAGQTMIHQTTA